ncbi:hypothetical protein YQE_02759, partial [Dendroctonus ponderosae]
MPEQPQIINTQYRFSQIASFPRVIGCIDCTHIRIISPGGNDAEVFRNRKRVLFYKCSSCIVCNSDLKICNIVARWPGSAHDSTIFANSRLKATFETNEYPNCMLLGDSGYPLKRNLLTPLPAVRNRGQQLYNEAHIHTRNCIERLFGTWKRRFPILAYGLRLKLSTSLTVIVAAAVLYNIAISMREEEPPDDAADQLNYLIERGRLRVHLIRNQLVNYFENIDNL